MKSLNEFLLEGFKLTKDYKKPDIPEIVIPTLFRDGEWADKIDHEDGLKFDTYDFKKIKKYLVFLDKYRGNLPHFANFGDFIVTLSVNGDDFEDFDLIKDILYTSDDLDDVINWYIKNYIDKNKKIHDNDEVIRSFLDDHDLVDDWYQFDMSKKTNQDEIDDFLNDIIN